MLLLVYRGSVNKQIFLESTKYFFKKIIEKVLKFLGKEPKLDIKNLSASEWKFVPEPNISFLEIVSVKNGKNDETVTNNNAKNDNGEIENDKSTSKKEQNIEISFNTESDVMIQTNYPLPKTFKLGKNY
jgi:hypothetical protein